MKFTEYMNDALVKSLFFLQKVTPSEILIYYGVRGVALSCISSYLSNRTQYVYNNNIDSDSMNITCGVPQGYILGPIIFLLYINYLRNTSKILQFVLFADDTNIFCTGKHKKELEIYTPI